MFGFSNTLKYIIQIENLVGVSRKWDFTDQRSWKGLFSAAIWIMSSISGVYFIETYLQFYEHEYSERATRVNTVLTVANTILTIVWGCATSKQFQELLFNLSETHCHLKLYGEYVPRSGNICTGVAIKLIIFLIVNFIGSVTLTITRLKTGILDVPIGFYWINIVSLACLIRAGIGYLLFYCVLHVMSVQLEFIDFDFKEISKQLRNISEENEINRDYAESLDQLCTAYIHACNSCRLINAIFSVPMSASFGLLVLYHILIAYVLITQSVNVGSTGIGLYQISLYALMLLPNLLALTSISVAGQQVHNNAHSITQALAYLLNVSNAGGSSYPVTRRAMRVVSTRQVHLVLFGSTKIGTALLPASLAFFTTYLIIALQFNNVL